MPNVLVHMQGSSVVLYPTHVSAYLKLNLQLNCYPFIFIYYRMERQRREEAVKNRSSKKGNDAEQAILNRV
jgi:hypothetical protein